MRACSLHAAFLDSNRISQGMNCGRAQSMNSTSKLRRLRSPHLIFARLLLREATEARIDFGLPSKAIPHPNQAAVDLAGGRAPW